MEKKQDNLVKDLLESEKAFMEQFDPNSKSYHKGNQTKVPTGGEKIPVSMPTEYPENVKNVQEYVQQDSSQINYGPEYNKIQEERNIFLNYKKAIAKLTQILEAILRIRTAIKNSNEPADQQHNQALEQNITQEKQKSKEAIKEILPLFEVVEKSEFNSRYKGFRELLEETQKEFKDKEAYTDYCFNLKRYGQNAFADASKMLEQMKKIKKNYVPPPQDKVEPIEKISNIQKEEEQKAKD